LPTPGHNATGGDETPQAVGRGNVSEQLAYAKQVDSFAAAVEGREAFPAPGQQGWRNQVILVYTGFGGAVSPRYVAVRMGPLARMVMGGKSLFRRETFYY
jgi:hypothetical protein